MDSSGISGMPKPEEANSVTGGPEGESGANIADLMNAKVSTLGQLKSVMIQYLGESDGTKLYNRFIDTFAMMMIQQVQQSAAQAKKAAQNMRMNT